MKRQALAVAVAFLLSIVAAGECYAHQQSVLVVNIPFAFQAGNKTLPAGEYSIESVSTGDGTLRMIRQIDGDALMIVATIAVYSKDGKSEPKLIFNRYGKRYFLSQIWAGEPRGQQLFKSEGEKELARTEAKVAVALLVHSPSVKP